MILVTRSRLTTSRIARERGWPTMTSFAAFQTQPPSGPWFAMPDRRLGERACAYIVPRPGSGDLTLEALVDFLRSRGAGPLQWPERLELVPALPETAVGKLDRVALRADVAGKIAGKMAG